MEHETAHQTADAEEPISLNACVREIICAQSTSEDSITTKNAIDPHFGHGSLTVTKIGKDAGLAVFDICPHHDSVVTFRAEERMWIIDCMQGSMQVKLVGSDEAWEETIKKGNVLVAAASLKDAHDQMTMQITLRAGVPFECAGFFFSANRFFRCFNAEENMRLQERLHQICGGHVCMTKIESLPELEKVFVRLRGKPLKDQAACRLILESRLWESMAYVLEVMLQDCGTDVRLDEYELQMISKIPERMASNLLEPPTIPQMAKEFGINETKLKKGFKFIYGIPVYQYFRKMKLVKAMDLLLGTSLPVGEIAFRCGYASQGQFGAAIKKECGVTPLQLRKQVIRG